jgi:CheY-like chemotaxis protein
VPSKVLVVEDDPSLCEFIREVLSSADLDAQAMTDSTQAADRTTYAVSESPGGKESGHQFATAADIPVSSSFANCWATIGRLK